MISLLGCTPKKDKRIVGGDIIGHWRAVDNDYRTATYGNLFFYRDSTAIFDCISDTVMFLRYKLVKDTLIIMKSSRLLKSLQIERSLLSLYCKNQDKHSSHVRSTGQRYNKI